MDHIAEEWRARALKAEGLLVECREERDEALSVVERLRAEAAARAEVERLRANIEELSLCWVCSYCGHREKSENDEKRFAAMTDHILDCKKHPIRLFVEQALSRGRGNPWIL